jgi:hypothetical protein
MNTRSNPLYVLPLLLVSLSALEAGCGGADTSEPLGSTSSAISGSCSEGPGYCTSTSQCEDHHWVPRDTDPAACTSGPGTTDSCSEGDGYCTATSQCDNHHWVDRFDDPAACTSGPGAGTHGSGGTPIARLDSEGYFGANLVHLGEFLVAHGYSKAGAAGIAGCVGGESTGNPESVGSGGGGLIGWTPLSSIHEYGGTIGGSPSKDLENQFEAILKYNERNDPGSIHKLNSFTNPVSAADFYSQVFERPAVLDSDVRAVVADAVFQALGG